MFIFIENLEFLYNLLLFTVLVSMHVTFQIMLLSIGEQQVYSPPVGRTVAYTLSDCSFKNILIAREDIDRLQMFLKRS